MINKKVKALSIVLALGMVALVGCSNDGGDVEKKSELFGTFTYQETLGLGESRLVITSDKSKTGDRKYIYSTVAPLEHIADTNVSYNMDQRLKLNRNYTYKYDYTITLTNPGDWGAQFARLVVSVTGTFDYRETGDGMYSVMLGDPTGGTKTIYASNINGAGIYDWSMHSRPDLMIDYAAAELVENFQYDKHVAGRIVRVDRNTKTLGDDIFDENLLDEITGYGSY